MSLIHRRLLFQLHLFCISDEWIEVMNKNRDYGENKSLSLMITNESMKREQKRSYHLCGKNKIRTMYSFCVNLRWVLFLFVTSRLNVLNFMHSLHLINAIIVIWLYEFVQLFDYCSVLFWLVIPLRKYILYTHKPE